MIDDSPPSDRPAAPEAPEALRQRADARTWRRSTPTPAQIEAMTPAEVLHELQVHQTELELQNEELRQAHKDLETLSTRYFDLYDLAPVGYCTINAQGLILKVNQAASVLLGRPRSALVKKPVNRFILPRDQGAYHLQRKQLL